MNITWWQLALWIFCITVGGMVAHYNHFSKKYGPEAYLWLHHSQAPKSHRVWITYNIKRNPRRQIKAKLEVVWNWKLKGYHHTGASIHFGGRGSETPIDIFLGLYFVSFFFGMNFPGLGRICGWLGRGHHRNISLKVHDGSIWWELWYDDQSGYDDWHRCDGWRRIWWWPFKNKKYRSWSCLRQGNIDLNPLDAIYGSQNYHYKTVDTAETILFMINGQDSIAEMPQAEFNKFYAEGAVEKHLLKLELQHVDSYRDRAPKWARGYKDCGYMASWRCDQGIPFRNNSWKGNYTYASAVDLGMKLYVGEAWPFLARGRIRDSINEDRKRYNYKSPAEVRKSIQSLTPVFHEVQKAYTKIGDAARSAAQQMQKLTNQINNQNEPRDLP